ncbi:sugar transferase [Roseovarius sp. M141]|uniref:sugar transferase n=1 Tax=Roseovarius sp. M141 TaxID=2583806 RepID=UPI0020CFDE5B|nr:sugar transferase [Roseovarius sp. M141]MCQ0091752.1 sugar transferase [Roseovarius sp. M141]
MSSNSSKPFETIGTAPVSDIYRTSCKRALDIFLALLAMPLVLPIIGILALLCALGGSKPFYGQDRIGMNGRIYQMWKLRSTVNDANPRAAQDRVHARDSGEDMIDGARLTGFGQFLRKSALDDLPQLFNVLIGDMSFVGPRPMTVSQRALYLAQDCCDLRPGITGHWQISDHQQLPLVVCAASDAHYNRNLSLSGDIAILVAATQAALRST